MKTAVIYTRVSSKEQVSGTSLDTQLSECRRFAARAGYTVQAVYTDAGLSAKTAADRPQLQAAIRHCAKAKTSALIVWKVDRLSRNTGDGIAIREMLRRSGCEVVSATEGFTADPLGDAMSSILLTFAQLDNAQRAVRCRTGMSETASRGGWCHRAPEGFDLAKTADGLPVLKINDTGRALQVILRRYAAGAISKTEYFKACASIGISAKTASKIPTRDVYAGIIREALTGGQPIRAAFDGLVTPAELAACRKRSAKLRRRASSGGLESTLRGLARCPCGRALSPYRSKGHVYWKCSRCGTNNISAEKLYAQLFALIDSAVYLADLLRAAAEYARLTAKQQIEQRRKVYAAQAREAAKARARLDRLTDLYLDGRIDEDTYTEKSSALRSDIEKSNVDHAAVDLEINEQITYVERTAKALATPRDFLASLSPERAKSALSYIFGQLILTPEKTLNPKSNPEKPSLHALISTLTASSAKKSGEPLPAAVSPDLPQSLMVEVRRVELLTF